MQGKCQKVSKYKKICEFSALFSGKSTVLLFLPAKTGHKAKKHFEKRPGGDFSMIHSGHILILYLISIPTGVYPALECGTRVTSGRMLSSFPRKRESSEWVSI
jgi:hypothetical protein